MKRKKPAWAFGSLRALRKACNTRKSASITLTRIQHEADTFIASRGCGSVSAARLYLELFIGKPNLCCSGQTFPDLRRRVLDLCALWRGCLANCGLAAHTWYWRGRSPGGLFL